MCVCVCVIQGRHRGARVIGTDRSFDMKYHKSGRHCDELGLTVMPQGAAFGHIGSNFAVFARHGRCHDADDNNGTGCHEKFKTIIASVMMVIVACIAYRSYKRML